MTEAADDTTQKPASQDTRERGWESVSAIVRARAIRVGGADSRPLGYDHRKSSPPRMSRTAVNFVVDATLLAVFLILAWVSVILTFVFPRGTVAHGWSLWGAGYDDWCATQFFVLCVFSLTVLLHVMLHWSWVCGVVASRLSRWKGRAIRPDDGSQTLYGVGLLIVLVNVLGLAIAAATLAIQAPMP